MLSGLVVAIGNAVSWALLSTVQTVIKTAAYISTMVFAVWAILFWGIDAICNEAWALLPTAQQDFLSPFVGYFEHANEWAPIGEFFVLLAAYAAFLVSFIIIKLVIKICVPTLG